MAYLTLFGISFVSATLFPLGSEGFLIYYIKENYNIVLLLFFATLGNTLGAVVNYYLGLKGEEYIIGKKLIKEKYILICKKYFDKYGMFVLLFSWAPFIGDPITFVAGILKYNFKYFIVLVALSKFLRYLFVALLILIS